MNKDKMVFARKNLSTAKETYEALRNETLSDILDFMRNNPSHPFSARELANISGLDASHIGKFLSSETYKKSPMVFLIRNCVRVKRYKEVDKNGNVINDKIIKRAHAVNGYAIEDIRFSRSSVYEVI